MFDFSGMGLAPTTYNNAHKPVASEMITINGEPRAMEPGATLLDVVRSLGLEPERVAVELDREIVKRGKWAETKVAGAAEIEIVQFVGGG